MKEVLIALVTDGPSDGPMLIPILEWLVRLYCGETGVKVVHVDTLRRRVVPKKLEKRIEFALEAYPCDCVFVHRDAEKEPSGKRREEIQMAVDSLGSKMGKPHVCVVPVRMTEAWLLFNEAAIRHASGNPNGRVELNLPRLSELEKLPDPKQRLHDILVESTGLSGRRRKSFDPKTKAHLVSRFLDDFSPLRSLVAFQELEDDLKRIVKEQRW